MAHEARSGCEVLLVAGCYEQIIFGYRVKKPEQSWNPEPDFTHHAHTASLTIVAANDQYVATGSKDETIQLYNMKKKIDQGSLLHHAGTVTCLEFYGTTHLLSGAEDGIICVWDTKKWECLKSLPAHKTPEAPGPEKNREHKERQRKRTVIRTSFIVLNTLLMNIGLRGNADSITSNPAAVNVSLPRSTEGPVTSHAALSWCAKFITWYSLSYVIEALLALAILCCVVQTMRLRKWRRRAYRARTPVYRIRSPIFEYDQTPATYKTIIIKHALAFFCK